MKQYWEIKSEMFDKVCLFKLGKFYEMFYQDAILCHKLLDMNWTHKEKLHVGFPEKRLDEHVQTLVSSGYKVVVVEQTETAKP